jgi:hypothetical protein
MDIHQNNRGSALLLVLILGSLVAAFAATTILTARNTSRAVSQNRLAANAFNIAEAGKEHGMALLKAHSVIPQAGAHTALADTAFSGGRYVVGCRANGSRDTLWLLSEGRFGDARCSIEVTCLVSGCIGGGGETGQPSGSESHCVESRYEVSYTVEVYDDGHTVKYEDAVHGGGDQGLGEDGAAEIDTFVIRAGGGDGSVAVTTKAATASSTVHLSAEGQSALDGIGFESSLLSVAGGLYVITIKSVAAPHALSHVAFDLGDAVFEGDGEEQQLDDGEAEFETVVSRTVVNQDCTPASENESPGEEQNCGGLSYAELAWRQH